MKGAVWIILIWCVAFAALNQLSKDFASKINLGGGLPQIAWAFLGSYKFWAMLALYFLCAGAYFIALKYMELSVAGPIFTMLGMLITLLLGVFFFKESMGMLKMLGVGLCLSGVCLLYASSSLR